MRFWVFRKCEFTASYFGCWKKLSFSNFPIFSLWHKTFSWTRHKHNAEDNEWEKGERDMEKHRVSMCLRALDFSSPFPLLFAFLLCFWKQEEEKSFARRIFPRVSRRQSANCYVTLCDYFLLVLHFPTQIATRKIFDGVESSHGDHYWLLFILNFEFFCTHKSRKLTKDSSKTTWAWKKSIFGLKSRNERGTKSFLKGVAIPTFHPIMARLNDDFYFKDFFPP